MAKRKFQPKTRELENTLVGSNSLPTNEPVAVYYRQSTDAQVGNISTDIQTVDMVDYLKRRGWHEDDIYMIDMDEGVSGTKKIDERPGMKALFELITDRKIRAVACQDEDRLFRDITQIQVNIFIQACKDANVLVITPSIVYDFAHEQLGTFHARQFRYKSEIAADYINTVIIGKLQRARQRLMQEGRWVGGRIPLGFMVDMRKTLPDGTNNPNWRKYVPFEPYAEIVAAYFRIFLEVGGNIGATLNRIMRERLFFPDPSACQPPEGFAIYYHLKYRGDGYYPGRSGLSTLLTNPSYIGHWCFQGAVISWNNHPAIVSTEVFTQAFNYLSEFGLDGSKNTSYRPIRQNARPSLDSERPVERPLCSGLMYGLVNGEWRQTSTMYVSTDKHYAYQLFERGILADKMIWQRHAGWVDEAISRHFHRKLRETFNTEAWQKTVTAFMETLERERTFKQKEIAALEAAKQNLIAGVEISSNPRFIQDLEARYEAMEQEQIRQQAELAAMENDHRQYDRLRFLQGTFEDAISRWEMMKRDEKRNILQIFVNRIEIFDVVPQGGMRLRFCWLDGTQEEIRVNRMPTNGHGWTQDEIDHLLAMVDEGASQADIAATFPTRYWRQISIKIRQFRGRVLFSPMSLSPYETYQDFLDRGGNPYRVSNANHWTNKELTQLRELVDRKSEQLKFMAAFPYRKWSYIRRKMRDVYGQTVPITKSPGVRTRDTYLEYVARHPDMTIAEASRDSPHGRTLACGGRRGSRAPARTRYGA